MHHRKKKAIISSISQCIHPSNIYRVLGLNNYRKCLQRMNIHISRALRLCGLHESGCHKPMRLWTLYYTRIMPARVVSCGIYVALCGMVLLYLDVSLALSSFTPLISCVMSVHCRKWCMDFIEESTVSNKPERFTIFLMYPNSTLIYFVYATLWTYLPPPPL